jgi:pyruvate/2-oxoacid:ferredoxin oxidoreductase alpha subunit
VEKAVSLGHAGPLYIEVKAAMHNKISANAKNFIVGLGGRDITKKMIKNIITKAAEKGEEVQFIGK